MSHGVIRIWYDDTQYQQYVSFEEMRDILISAIEGTIRGTGTHREKRQEITRLLELMRQLDKKPYGIPF